MAPAAHPHHWRIRSLFQAGIGRDIATIFLLLTLIGLAVMQAGKYAFDRQAELASQVDHAGRLRMLSQAIAYQAHQISSDRRAPRTKLNELVERFDDNVAALRKHFRVTGVLEGERRSPELSLAIVEREWLGYRAAALIVSNHPSESAETMSALGYIDQHAGLLLAKASENVQQLLDHNSLEEQRLRSLLPAVLLAGVLFSAGAYFYVRHRFLYPLRLIEDMSRQFALGNLEARIQFAPGGEMGQLIADLNSNADTYARTHHAIRDSELRNRTLWETSTDAILLIDRDCIIRFGNPMAHNTFGYQQDELIGQNLAMIQPERLREAHRRGFGRYLQSGQHRLNWQGVETWALHRDGHEFPVELSFTHIRLSSGDMFAGFFRDATQRRASMAALWVRERAMESAREGIIVTDATQSDSPIVYANPAVTKITGYSNQELLERRDTDLLRNVVDPVDAENLGEILHQHREQTLVLRCLRKDRSEFWNEISISPVHDAQGNLTHMIRVIRDVTERKRQELAMLHLAQHDELTGLPNQILIQDRLEQAVAAATRHQRALAVLFIDIDHFKVINDSLGHEIGDQLLRQIAARLTASMRDGDTAARVTGDEFLLLLGEIDQEEDAVPVASRVLAALALPFQIEGHELFVSASIGISVCPRDGTDGPALIRQADIAMYRAKEQGRNTYQLFTREMQSRVSQRLTLETKLRRALERDEFLLHFQPQLNLGNGALVGAEALIRWRHPELGMVSPAQFIPAAEDTGLIVPIGEWVIETACSSIRALRDGGSGVPRIAVNLSARQFHQPNLLKVIEHALRVNELASSCLEMEVTESMVMRDPAKTIDTLGRMRDMGLSISLDDFGTGYSSLNHLRRFPIDVLKVDQSFIRDVVTNADDAAIIAAIIALAHSLDLKVVAEGVETAEQLQYLLRQHCDCIQGYYFSKPLALPDFQAFLAASGPRDPSLAHY